jgi:hypothetical protein
VENSAADLVGIVADFVAGVVGGIVLVEEVGLPICQAKYYEAELEGRCSESTDTAAAVKLQAL